MLFVKRGTDGRIDGAIDYYLVNDRNEVVLNGQGRWVWVEQLMVSTGADGKAIIREFIDDIARAFPQAVGAYWYRKNKTGERVHRFTRRRLVREES